MIVNKIGYKGQMVVFGNDGINTFITSSKNDGESPLDVLLIGSISLNESISQYGPFVTNTPEEIHRALEDYRSGKMGIINQ
jgi:redox-sensitive bicupin YhaK (pirin superfamily)